ncbi:hypothetical protein PVAND_007027 [Polypedilum vanderplanki]|uniref:DUF4485 domain-containing protein n=1 Tax=Polypedilum vanderplanki TaxID=319348 RepID=A0A9J6C5J6_POLVA|nr:hypothetical protein PVAND_007027 [Polypedilum vanderplanki]
MPVNPFVNDYGELSNELLLNIAEILTLKLPDGIERIIASKWVKKFFACDPNVYKDNLSLFISCLTKGVLVKPFDEAPQDLSNEWKNFDREYTTKNINAAVTRRLYKDSFTPPYKFEISQDMKEYMAYQEIPFFGAHFYYAFSPRDPIYKWRGFNKMNVPRNLVEKLWKTEEIESPIKGRFFEKPKKVPTVAINVTAKKTPKAKPAWQGPIAEEPEEAKKEIRSMISIPITERIKHLPPALQRRMLKADKEREEKLILLQQEKAEREKRLEAQKTKGRFAKGSKSTKTVVKKPSVDKVKVTSEPKEKSVKKDAVEPKATTSRSPEMPEFTGPQAELQRKLYKLRKSNPPEELIQTTRDMNTLSRDINVEALRLRREGKPNLKNVENLHEASSTIGNRVLRMMKNQQAAEIGNAAINGCEAITDVQVTMDQLNKMLKKNVQPREDTLMRLAEIKRNMAESAEIAKAVQEVQNEKIVAEDVVALIDKMKKVNEIAQEKLENLRPESREEKTFINDLIEDNDNLASQLHNQSVQLVAAIENNHPNTASIIKKTIQTVDDLLEMSFSKDEEIDEIQSDAANIQLTKNQKLEELKQGALEIENQIDNIFKTAASNKLVAKYLQVSNDDDDDEIIDLASADVDLGETIDDDFMKNEKLNSQAKLYDIAEEDEDLLNISDTVLNEIEKSIEIIEKGLIPELRRQRGIVENEKKHRHIEMAVENLENNAEYLKDQLAALDDAISNTTLVPLDNE